MTRYKSFRRLFIREKLWGVEICNDPFISIKGKPNFIYCK